MAWKTFVAVGDSLIAGTGDVIDGIEHVSWSERVAHAIAPLHREFTFTNLARPGLKAAEIRAEQLAAALALKPDLVSISVGGNDMYDPNWDYDAVYEEIDAMFKAFHAIGATVLTFAYTNLAEVLPKPTPGIITYFTPHVMRLNSITRAMSEKYNNVALFDAWQQPEDLAADGWSTDYVHLNSLGQIRMARMMAATLSQYSRIEIFGESLRLPEKMLVTN